MNNPYNNIEKKIMDLPGPIAIFGAGGFVGINLLNTILKVRQDVIGISQDHHNSWRFIANNIPRKNRTSIDILQQIPLKIFFNKYKPATIFNLAAYGAYSKQNEYDKIYQTNFVATVDMIEIAKEIGFKVFIQAGSSSEYGLNSCAPAEDSILIPNSHYAVSKAALYQAIKYYGLIENLPIVQLRLYSVYGPWEEPDRLIPVLISKARLGEFPPLVNPMVSRDFIHIDDVISAFILAANQVSNIKGEALNIGTGIKTTIQELSKTVKEIFNISTNPEFGKMPNRKWDLEEWYSNPELMNKKLDFKAEISLKKGLLDIGKWQEEINFDKAFWNWNK